MLFFQILLYCLLFLLMVKCLARDSGRNCLYFYPQDYLEEAQKRGLIEDKDAVLKKGKLWHIEGMEGVPYIKPWKTVLIKRGLATVLYLAIAPIIAGPAVLLTQLLD